MFRIIFALFVLHLVSSQDYVEDNIAMETVAGKNLEFSNFGFENGPNRFSTFLSRAGELLSDSDFGNKIKHDGKKPKVIHAVKVKEVSKKDETDFTNKRQIEYNSLGNLTNQVKMNKLSGILMKQQL